MHLQDKLTIDDKRRTRDGFMAVSARVARAGNVQLYSGREVDPDNHHGFRDNATVRVYRPEDEVFSAGTMKSFAHKPITLGHPGNTVTAGNWKDVAKGWSDGDVVRDGEFVRVNMLLADSDAIQAVENGTRELSMGYDCDLNFTPGTTPSGEAYDAVQRNIRSNHIAVVPQARGGSQLRIGDSANHIESKPLTMMTDAEIMDMKASVCGMPLSKAMGLPIYQEFKGHFTDGRPAEEMRALYDGAVPDAEVALTKDHVKAQARADAARENMVYEMRNQPTQVGVNDNNPADGPQYARDGRPMYQLSDSERARERMIHDLANTHNHT